MNNFSINPNFNPVKIDNTFQNNKISNNFDDTSNKNFEEIFNSIGQKNQLQGGIEAIDTNKQINATQQIAQELKNGFTNGIDNLNSIQRQAEKDFETFASGGDISVHEVMISAQKSNLAMQMAIQLRNQMLNAYNEFKGMSI